MSEKFEAQPQQDKVESKGDAFEIYEGQEKLECIERALALHEELQKYDGETYSDKETNDKLEALAAALEVELKHLAWFDKVENGLPWNPRDEFKPVNEHRKPQQMSAAA